MIERDKPHAFGKQKQLLTWWKDKLGPFKLAQLTPALVAPKAMLPTTVVILWSVADILKWHGFRQPPVLHLPQCSANTIPLEKLIDCEVFL